MILPDLSTQSHAALQTMVGGNVRKIIRLQFNGRRRR